MTTIGRRIHFFDVRFLRWDGDGREHEIPGNEVIRSVRELPPDPPARGPSSRYSPLENEDTVLMEIRTRWRDEYRGLFAVKRRSAIPPIEDRGTYSDLTLAAGQGLAEIRHFLLWPRRHLLGMEVNGRGPTLSRLNHYLVEKCGDDIGLEHVDLRMRLTGDQFDLLERTSRISSATVEVVRDRLDAVGHLDPSLEGGLQQIARSTNARTVAIELRLGDRHADASLELPWRDRARGFFARPDHREAIEKFRVQARDEIAGGMRTIDLLEDQFVGYEEVVTVRAGVVDEGSIYDAIRRSARALPE